MKKSERKYAKPSDTEIKKALSPLQYEVTQNSATEKPHTSKYNKENRQGIYVDIVTKEPLFSSLDKYDAGCGWPSFDQSIEKENIEEVKDTTHGMTRIEVRSKKGDSHLGHVFTDGPKDTTGLRYCINGASIEFIPKEEMAQKGYEDLLYLFEEK